MKTTEGRRLRLRKIDRLARIYVHWHQASYNSDMAYAFFGFYSEQYQKAFRWQMTWQKVFLG